MYHIWFLLALEFRLPSFYLQCLEFLKKSQFSPQLWLSQAIPPSQKGPSLRSKWWQSPHVVDIWVFHEASHLARTSHWPIRPRHRHHWHAPATHLNRRPRLVLALRMTCSWWVKSQDLHFWDDMGWPFRKNPAILSILMSTRATRGTMGYRVQAFDPYPV